MKKSEIFTFKAFGSYGDTTHDKNHQSRKQDKSKCRIKTNNMARLQIIINYGHVILTVRMSPGVLRMVTNMYTGITPTDEIAIKIPTPCAQPGNT